MKWVYGCIHLLNTRKYWDNTRKYCGNAHQYWPNIWKMCSPASAIFASIVTILVSFEAILMYFKACCRLLLLNWLLKLILTENLYKIASKLTSILTILANMYCNCKWPHFSSIDSILVSITIILTSIVTILVSIEQVNTPYAFLSNVLKIGNLLSLPLSFYFPKKNFKKSNSWNCKSNSFKTVT